VLELKEDNLAKIYKETEKIIYSRSIANSADVIFEDDLPHNQNSEGCVKCRIF
jgi:hypothetical protein